MQIAIRSRDPTPQDTAPLPDKKSLKRDPKPAKLEANVPLAPTTPDAAPNVEPPKPDNSATLSALKTSHSMLDNELRRRELLESDVPAYSDAKRQMADALVAADPERAAKELDRARAAIARVTIDGPFINAKVSRAGTRIGKLDEDRRTDLSARLNIVMSLYTSGDFVKANRQINEIVKLTATNP